MLDLPLNSIFHPPLAVIVFQCRKIMAHNPLLEVTLKIKAFEKPLNLDFTYLGLGVFF